jgi:hypothetical protein
MTPAFVVKTSAVHYGAGKKAGSSPPAAVRNDIVVLFDVVLFDVREGARQRVGVNLKPDA